MLIVKGVDFGYEPSRLILKNISFGLAKGSVLGLMGESGSGKSTLLRILYGLLDTTKGQLYWNGQEILGPKYHLIPGMPFMKYLAQDFDLMPYTTVEENIGQFLSNIHKAAKQDRVEELLNLVDMSEFAKTKVKLLSGGQMQRVALAKALALEPEVLLLDEPFSHIDHFRKNELRRSLFAYVRKKEITLVIATHHIDDVLAFADEIIVVKDGTIIATGAPNRLYEDMSSLYVARLLGEVNVLPARWFGIAGKEYVYMRPQQLKIAATGIKGKVKRSYYLGMHYVIEVMIEERIVYVNHAEPVPEGTFTCITTVA